MNIPPIGFLRQALMAPPLDHGGLAEQRVALLLIPGKEDDDPDIFQQAEGHRDMGPAVLADLVEGDVHHLLEGRRIENADPYLVGSILL